jgi:hypothetical protein
MYVVFIICFTCGCDGNCTGNNIQYDESQDEKRGGPCLEHQYISPPTSSDDSVSETSTESPQSAE